MQEPINNPGVTPSPSVTPPGQEKPGLGAGEETEQRRFSLPQEPGPGRSSGAVPTAETDKPSPFDLAREGTKGQRWSPEEMQDNMQHLQQQLNIAKTNLQNPELTKNFTDDHNKALTKIVEKMNPDMKTIARGTGQADYEPVKQSQGQSVIDFVAKWIGQSQDTMANSVNYVNAMSSQGSPDLGGMMKLQFAMNRSQEKAELFSSVISATTSGIKQILSTQLG